MTSHRAFLCHATPDKGTYVEPFGRYLASKGVDPWIDDWEMKPGDSLLTKIETGISDAAFFLPFLSPRCIDRPWFRAEIEMAVARKLVDQIRIIPILVDVRFEDISLFLQTLLGVRIDGEAGIPGAAQEVVDAIYGISAKPLVAKAPAYAATPSTFDLSSADNALLKAACEQSIESRQSFIGFEGVARRLMDSDMEMQTMKDSASVLSERGYLRVEGVVGNPYAHLEVLPHGFDAYASQFVDDYGGIYRRIATKIAGAPDYNQGFDGETIAEELGLPLRLVNHVYEHLAARGKITLSSQLSPGLEAATVSATFRREMMRG